MISQDVLIIVNSLKLCFVRGVAPDGVSIRKNVVKVLNINTLTYKVTNCKAHLGFFGSLENHFTNHYVGS